MNIFLKYLILPLITTCIVVAGVVVFYHLDMSRNIQNTSLSEAGIAKKQESTSAVRTVKEATDDPPIYYKGFVYPMDNTRDPFQKTSALADAQEPLKDVVTQLNIMLTGIIWDEENPVAIIADSDNNSYLVRTGEEIRKAKILNIQPRSITIERDGETQELVLWPAKL